MVGEGSGVIVGVVEGVTVDVSVGAGSCVVVIVGVGSGLVLPTISGSGLAAIKPARRIRITRKRIIGFFVKRIPHFQLPGRHEQG